MSEQFLGDRIRELREKKNLSIEELYSRTKILIKYLEAIEEGRWDLLPGQVYLKPFLKNIAIALEVNPQELYDLIEDSTNKKESSETAVEKKGFDYRWIAIILMLILVGLVIFLLGSGKINIDRPETETSPVDTVEAQKGYMQERKFSSNLDLFQNNIEYQEFHTIMLLATDSVWLVLTSGADTLYKGILVPGRQINRRSAKPFEMFLGRSNCLDIVYDGVRIDQERYLKEKKRLVSTDFEFIPEDNSGG